MARSIEKIENQIWNNYNLYMSTVVTNGSKNKDNVRLDSMYLKKFNSSKYSNFSELEQLTIKPTSYLVFGWRGNPIDEDGNKGDFLSIDVYMSYKHVEIFRDFITNVYDEITSNVDKIYQKNKINPKFEELIYTSEPFINDRTISIYPDILTTEDGHCYNAVTIFVNGENEEQGQTISFDSFYTLQKLLEEYSLLEDSRLTVIEGMLYQLLNGGLSSGSSSGGNGFKPRTLSGNPRFKNKGVRNILDEADDTDDDSSSNDFADDDEKEEAPKRTVRKTNTVKKSSPTKKKTNTVENDNSISMDAMLKKGEEFSLDDDDEDGELF